MKAESAPLRVAFVITAFEVGGAENQIRRLISAFQSREAEVSLVILNGRSPYVDDLDRCGVRSIALNLHRRGHLTALPRMIVFLRKARSNALVCFLPHACLIGRLAAPAAGIPRVINSHRSTVLTHGWLRKALKATGRLNRKWVGNSNGVREFLIQCGLATVQDSCVVYNGIDQLLYQACPEKRKITRDSLGFREEQFVWIAVGRLHVSKDYPTLFRAFASLKAQKPNTELVIVGEGSLREELADLLRELRISESVHMIGHRSDVIDLLRASDGFAMASIYEGMSNALLEAASFGLPVACTRVGGVEEILPPGYERSIVEPGDTGGLVTAMLAVQNMSPEARAKSSKEFKAFTSQRFGIDSVADQWLELIRQL